VEERSFNEAGNGALVAAREKPSGQGVFPGTRISNETVDQTKTRLHEFFSFQQETNRSACRSKKRWVFGFGFC
jgi:hypothetical protein